MRLILDISEAEAFLSRYVTEAQMPCTMMLKPGKRTWAYAADCRRLDSETAGRCN